MSSQESRVHALILPRSHGKRFSVVMPGGSLFRHFEDYHQAYAYALAIRDYADCVEDGAGAEHSERGEVGRVLAARSPSATRQATTTTGPVSKAMADLIRKHAREVAELAARERLAARETHSTEEPGE